MEGRLEGGLDSVLGFLFPPLVLEFYDPLNLLSSYPSPFGKGHFQPSNFLKHHSGLLAVSYLSSNNKTHHPYFKIYPESSTFTAITLV